MNEKISLHGGPRHGQEMVIPQGHDDLEVEVLLTKAGQPHGTRSGHYTRVHNVSGSPSDEFEWSGFTTPFVPQIS